MSEHTHTCLFEPSEDGGVVVTCPALPGLVTQGDTLEEARSMAAEAIGLYLESVLTDGERLPISEDNVPGTIRAAIDTDEQLADLERARGRERAPSHHQPPEVAWPRARAERGRNEGVRRRRDQAHAAR